MSRQHPPRSAVRKWLPWVALVALALVAIYMMPGGRRDEATAARPLSRLKLADIPFDGARAYGYLQQICALGPRISGTPGMLAQQKLLTEHFRRLGGRVRLQPLRARHPRSGAAVELANLLVEWHPERTERVLLCCHYDTRPLPDRDRDPRQRRGGTFLGANDGASGVALLMELATQMPELESKYGVDFAFFDAEEFVYDDDRDPYFLGSEWFARQYVADPPAYRYRWGVLLDMVADADLQIYQEKNSMKWPETRPLVASIWKTAARLGVREFIAHPKYEIRDDHLPLRNIGRIPTCDIIDFDFPAWHTTGDVPRQCSALSLAKVGWVVRTWLEEE